MEKFFADNIILTEVSLAGYVPPGAGICTQKKRPNHGLMISCVDGKVCEFEGGKKFYISKGDILYYPKNLGFYNSGERGHNYVINFELSDTRAREPFVFKTKNRGDFVDSFKEVEIAWRRKNTGYEMKCMSLIYKILYNIRKEAEFGYAGKRAREVLSPAIEYIHEHYTSDKISISHLAAICGISETYLRNNFQKVFAASPVKYINNLRFARAKELMKTGMYSVLEVSLMSGFNDEAYFSREFKKIVGVNPSEYKGLNG